MSNWKDDKSKKLIEDLRYMKEALGKTPSQNDCAKFPSVPSHMTFVRHFGDWNSAIKAAGLEPNKLRRKKIRVKLP